MGDGEKVLSKSKKLVLKLAVGLIVFLILCTFVSRSIYTTLLPKVEVVKVEMKELSTEARMAGKIYYSDEGKIMAKSTAKVLEIFVKQGDKVKKGDKLFAVDTLGYSIKKKRLQLAIMNIENQLKPNEMSAAQKAETQAQLDIARKEFELLEINKNIEKSLKDGQYGLEQAQFREQSALTQAQLSAAYAQWNEFLHSSTEVDYTEEMNLRNLISGYMQQLENPNLTPENRAEIDNMLKNAMADLEKLLARPSQEYDYVLENQYRTAVIQAQNNILLLDENMSENRKNSVRIEYDLAQKKYREYLQTHDIQTGISEQKLKLDILKYENMLNPQNISASQKAEISLSLDIAKQELADFLATMSADGIMKAADDCEIISVSAEVMTQFNEGDTLLMYRKNEANPCVKWEISFDAGNSLSERTDINVTFKKQAGKMDFFATQESQIIEAENMKYNEETNTWDLSAKLKPFDGVVQAGSTAEIVMRTSSEIYQTVIPLACLNKSADENYTVMKKMTRKGLFSEETYVEEVSVKVLEKDNFSAAVESSMLMGDGLLVKYTSKPLTNGTIVSLQ